MRREHFLELLDGVPFKFRTKNGTVISIISIIDAGPNVLAFTDKNGTKSFIPYSEINAPIIKIKESDEDGNKKTY